MNHELGLGKTEIQRSQGYKKQIPKSHYNVFIKQNKKNTVLIIEHQIEESVADVSEYSLMLTAALQKLGNCSCCSRLKNTTEGT